MYTSQNLHLQAHFIKIATPCLFSERKMEVLDKKYRTGSFDRTAALVRSGKRLVKTHRNRAKESFSVSFCIITRYLEF